MAESETGEIPFRQYLLPHGDTRDVRIERPSEIARKAAGLIEAGCIFEAEILSTGHVSLTCERDDERGDTEVLAHEVVPNGPGVPPAVDRLVLTAHEKRGGEPK